MGRSHETWLSCVSTETVFASYQQPARLFLATGGRIGRCGALPANCTQGSELSDDALRPGRSFSGSHFDSGEQDFIGISSGQDEQAASGFEGRIQRLFPVVDFGCAPFVPAHHHFCGFVVENDAAHMNSWNFVSASCLRRRRSANC